MEPATEIFVKVYRFKPMILAGCGVLVPNQRSGT